VTQTRNTFTVIINPGPCLSPLVLGTFTLPLGRVEPGDYEVVVNPPARTGYAMFFVRDADAAVFVTGPSIGPTSGGTEVTLYADAVNCFGPDLTLCPLPIVTFNSVRATVIQEKFISGTLAVIAPPNTKGVADVVVSGARATKHGRVFRYYDPAEAPPSTMFERVLVPVYAFGPGAFGSNWTTEVMLLNNTQFAAEPYRLLPARIAAQSTISLDFGASRPGGVLFFPPRESSSELSFGSLVRDTSRQVEDWGTEVPVVRENEFRNGKLNLLNVPIDPRFRQTCASTIPIRSKATFTCECIQSRQAERSPKGPCYSEARILAVETSLARAMIPPPPRSICSRRFRRLPRRNVCASK